MNVTLEKLEVDRLEIGMYVSKLDKCWLETPFLLQGFIIESKEDLKQLRQHCTFVYIDMYLGVQGHNKNGSPGRRKTDSKLDVAKQFPNVSVTTHKDTSEFSDELKVASNIIDGFDNTLKIFFDRLNEEKTLNVSSLKSNVRPLVKSMLRNPDASIWLVRIRSKGSYIYKHSVGCAIWAIALGRELGLPVRELNSLALGALLLDIGKLQVPEKILNKKSRLTPDEFELIKQHTEFGVQMLADTPGLNANVIEMIRDHHERFNGSGYPKCKESDDIPVYARIAAIVDCYDAITSERLYASPINQSEALKKLYELRDIDFQAELVEEFIQAVGIYPAGTLVGLSDGTVGVVMCESRHQRLRPKILILLDKNKKELKSTLIVDLQKQSLTSDGNILEIDKSIEPGVYDISPSKLSFF
jgi:putative nucleotidyltransferase with HDIG domain